MKQVFCYNCGLKMEYNHSPPNFCGKCGTSVKNGEAKAVVKTPRTPREEGDNDNLSDVDEVPEINKLELEDLEVGAATSITTLGDMLNNPTPSKFAKARNSNLGDFINEKRG